MSTPAQTEPLGNQPAFPETRWHDATGQDLQFQGMTKREHFAIEAMVGLLACPAEGTMSDPRDWRFDQFAEAAVKAADALLAELSKGQKL